MIEAKPCFRRLHRYYRWKANENPCKILLGVGPLPQANSRLVIRLRQTGPSTACPRKFARPYRARTIAKLAAKHEGRHWLGQISLNRSCASFKVQSANEYNKQKQIKARSVSEYKKQPQLLIQKFSFPETTRRVFFCHVAQKFSSKLLIHLGVEKHDFTSRQNFSRFSCGISP